jgi:cation diffusion facilitator family transporter
MSPPRRAQARVSPTRPSFLDLVPEPTQPVPLPLNPHALAAKRAHDGARLVLRGVLLNLFLAALKFTGGILGNTYALIADGVESLLDVASSLLVWAGIRYAAKPPDADHPYGHGKAEPLASLAVALVIFAAAGWIAIHAVREILTPHHAPHWATLPLLAFVIVTKWGFSRRLARAGEQSGGTALGAEAWHHAADALTSAAAFLGIAVAVLGGPAYADADDWAALAACLVIAFNGLLIFRRAFGEIMDVAASPDTHAAVRRVAGSVTGVRAVDKCRVRRSGLTLLVDIQIVVDPAITVREGHSLAHQVQDALVAAGLAITHVSVHVEPSRENTS